MLLGQTGQYAGVASVKLGSKPTVRRTREASQKRRILTSRSFRLQPLVQTQRNHALSRSADLGNVNTVIVPDQNSQMTALSPDLPDDFRVGFREF